MHLSFWRPALSRRSAAKRLVASAGVLALVVGLLTASLLFTRHAAAAPGQQHSTRVSLQAQSGSTPRLGVFEADGGAIWYQWSDDQGATWSDWYSLGRPDDPYSYFTHRPAVVSDGPGRLVVLARDQQNFLWE